MDLTIIQNKIYEIRGERVMLDRDLAEMYQVETRRLNEVVKRNIKRFPADFMFELTKEEVDYLRSQIAILKEAKNEATSQRGKHSKYLPYVFTEQGVAMLSGLLNSDIAINVNISIMRAFVSMRRYLASTTINSAELAEIKQKIKLLEHGADETIGAVNDLSEDMRKEFDDIYMALAELSRKNLLASENKERTKIGFKK